jgi:REP element-mobilizing transposase RayT
MISCPQGLPSTSNRNVHWRLEGSAYFVTWRICKEVPELTDDERDWIVENLKFFHGKRHRLFALVVMNDHVHVIVQPLAGNKLSKIVQGWKSYTAHQIQIRRSSAGSLWQKDYHDRIIRNESHLHKCAEYILGNPLRRWPGKTEYRWVEWFEF